ncbi:MAG: PQQ-like beta-propeller repeat protein, partial [Elusimicrobiales bacterium]|nr:PQQ-like beta-propeller repeat protein [Elusimicrobiales bacterium]
MSKRENRKYRISNLFGFLASLSAVIVLQICLVQIVRSENWPMFQYDAAHSGYNQNESIKLPFEKDSINIGNEAWGFSSPIISNGAVYFGTVGGEIMARQFPDGNLLWKINIGASVHLAPVIADGKLIFGSVDGYLAVVEAETGKYLWSFKTGSNINASPIVSNNKVIAFTNSGHVFAVDIVTGDLIWKTEIPWAKGDYIQSSPASDGLRVYGMVGSVVFAVDIN